MNAFGLLPTGFSRMQLTNVKAYFEAKFVEMFGDVRTDSESVDGQIIGIMSDAGAKIWEQLENVYLSEYPNSAEGAALDNAVAYNGVIRLPATRTTVNLSLYTESSSPVTVPADTVFQSRDTGLRYTLIETTVINKTLPLIDSRLVPTQTESARFSVMINGVSYAKESAVEISNHSVVSYLASIINAAGIGVLASEIVVDSTTSHLRLLSEDKATLYTIELINNLDFINYAVNTQVECTVKGPNICLQDTLTIIETPVSQLTAVNNLLQGVTGRPQETDTALRVRRQSSIQIVGVAVVDAIRARLLQYVPDITQCYVYENASDSTLTNNQPPHSIHCVVAGPDTEEFKQAVAEQIWATKSAGIGTFGLITRTVRDSQGTNHSILFSTATYVEVYIRLVVVANAEEELPDGWQQLVKQNILAAAATLPIGGDIIYQKLLAPIYQVPGIAEVTISISLDDFTWFTNTNVPIAESEVAIFNESRISFV